MTKVYCQDCIYRPSGPYYCNLECNKPSIETEVRKENYDSPEKVVVYKKYHLCKHKNHYYDCPDHCPSLWEALKRMIRSA